MKILIVLFVIGSYALICNQFILIMDQNVYVAKEKCSYSNGMYVDSSCVSSYAMLNIVSGLNEFKNIFLVSSLSDSASKESSQTRFDPRLKTPKGGPFVIA
jgi:hypothetical protein